MIPFRKSIGFRLLAISFILLTLPLLVDSFVLVHKRYQQTIGNAKAHLIEMSHLHQLPLLQLQFINKPMVSFLSDYLDLEREFPQHSSEKINKKLKEVAEIGGFYGVFLIKKTVEGKYIVVGAGDPQLIGKDYSSFFNLNTLSDRVTLEKGYESYISFDGTTLRPFFVIAQEIYSFKEGRNVGLLAIVDDVTDKLHALLNPDKRYYKVNFALLLPSTIVFAATQSALRFQYFLPLPSDYKELFTQQAPEAAALLSPEPLPVSHAYGFPFFEFTWNGEEQIGYIKRPPGANYTLLTYASKNDIFQIPMIDFFDVYTVYGIVLVIGGTLATLFTMRMVKPIQDLSAVMEKIQSGDLNVRYQDDPLGFEINVLGRTFNEMIDTVLHQQSVAEEERTKREIYAQELRLGQQAQRSLLPKVMPHYPGVELAEKYIPAIEVGGDFYDVFIREQKSYSQLVLAIADASGKGVQACFYSLSLRNMLRTYAKEYGDIAQAMSSANNLFYKDTQESGMFVTVLAATYDDQTKILNYYSCGHNPGLIRRRGGYVETLEHEGMAMGVLPSDVGMCHTVQLEVGDSLIFYTDGITEAHNEKYEFFGEERLIECLENQEFESAAAMIEEIISRVTYFVGKAPQHDDITLLVMKIR